MAHGNELQSEMINSDREFSELVNALKELKSDLRTIFEISSFWYSHFGIDTEPIETLMKFEIIDFLGAVIDRNCEEDDALSSLILFLLEADLDDDLLSLRQNLETQTQPGASTVFANEDELFKPHKRIADLTNPSIFMENCVLLFDKLLLNFECEARYVDLYLGAFAKFAFAILDLSILIEDKAMAVVRSGTFCAVRLQYKELLLEFPNENSSQLKEKFSYNSEKSNLIDSLRTSLEFGARFESAYIEALTDLANSVFVNLINDVEIQDSDEPAMDSAEGLEPGAYPTRDRLINLQELYDSGLLSSEEYQRQRRVIIDGI
jgi:hypothetical protein